MATKKTPPPAKPVKQRVPSGKLRDEADRRLRERYPMEAEEILRQVYEDAGFTYRRRLTPEERAEQTRLEKVAKARAQVQQLLDELGDEVLPPSFSLTGQLVEDDEDPDDEIAILRGSLQTEPASA